MSSRPLLLVVLLTAACAGRRAERPFDRIAILPFDNLSADAGLDWIGPLAPGVIATQTTGAARLLPLVATGEFDLARLRATQALRGYYQMEGSRLRLRATLTDIATNRTVRAFDHSGPASDGPLPLLDALSKDLADKVRPYPSSNREAVASLGSALLETGARERAQLAESAYRKDPALTPAAIEAAQTYIASGDPASAAGILRSLAPGESAESAQAGLMLALLERNQAAIRPALETAVRFSPRNSDLLGELGQLATRARDYGSGVRWFQKAIELEPEHPGPWNLLSYTQAYAGDFPAALASVEHLRTLSPQDPNSFDSIGEINWMAGRFDQAYKSFLEAQQKDPLFQGGLEFAKAAFSRLMAGDTAGADQLFGRYLESRRAAADPIVDLRQAHWLSLTGRRAQALEASAKLAAAGGELGSRAASFRSMWLAQAGRREEAQAMAANARGLARSPGAVNMAALAGLLASPNAPPQAWLARAQALFHPNAPASFAESALAYALFLNGHYKEAAAILERLVRQTNPGVVDELQSLLAGARLQLGDAKGAFELLNRWPLPPVPGESLFASLWFPNVIEWRGKATASVRGAAAAQPMLTLFQALEGNRAR